MNNILITIAKKKNISLSFLFLLFAAFTDDNEIKMAATDLSQEKWRELKTNPSDEEVFKNSSSDIWVYNLTLKSIGGGGGQDDFDSGGGDENPGAYNDPTETLSIGDDAVFLCILISIYGIYLHKKKKHIEQKK